MTPTRTGGVKVSSVERGFLAALFRTSRGVTLCPASEGPSRTGPTLLSRRSEGKERARCVWTETKEGGTYRCDPLARVPRLPSPKTWTSTDERSVTRGRTQVCVEGVSETGVTGVDGGPRTKG